jgi:Bacterial protein of unknown function (Gcw_chp)
LRAPRSRRKRRKPEVRINLGGRGWSVPDRKPPTSDRAPNQLEFDFRGGFATDYIYRGTTLSDHKPAVGAAIEATFAQLYAGVAVASVKLPTQPSAEITMSGGIRQTIGNVDFDLGATYFLYPGEIVASGSNGIDYWEAAIRADKRISESIRLAGGFAYSQRLEHGRLGLVRGRRSWVHRARQFASD